MTLLGFTSSVVAALTLQHILLLSAHDETLTEQRLRGADSTAVCPLHFAEESFAASVRDSVERLSLEHRPLLVHTRNEAGADSLVYVRKAGSSGYNIKLHTSLYYHLQAISHRPVSAVAVLARDISLTPAAERQTTSHLTPDTVDALHTELETLECVRELVNKENFPDPGQVSRQLSVLDTTQDFVLRVIDSETISTDMLREFGRSLENELRQNANDAVSDYLQSLNLTISELLNNKTISSEDFTNISVLIDLPPFSTANSFLLQYYEQLLDFEYEVDTEDPDRIILSSSTPQTNVTLNTTVEEFSASELTHIITQSFYGSNSIYSSPHLYLSQAASDIICSQQLTFVSCAGTRQRETETLPPGFRNPTERAYIAVIIFIGSFCVVLIIVVACIFNEGKVMKIERRTQNPLFSAKQTETTISNENANIDNASDEEEEEFASEPVTRSARFYRMKESLKRQKYQISAKVKRTGQHQAGPPVTYSEVSVHQ